MVLVVVRQSYRGDRRRSARAGVDRGAVCMGGVSQAHRRGLFRRRDQTNALPWIGEVPVLGALFKSNDFQRGESELVIIVTPYIVQPASSPSALRTPMDNFRPATDLDRILFGRQMASGSPQTRPVDAGFILK